MKNITHIFFDLDHTLWDYDSNSKEVLEEIYLNFNLQEVLSSSCDEFVNSFYQVNAQLWNQYNLGEIDRDHIRKMRFIQVLEHCGEKVGNGLSNEVSEYFMYNCPRRSQIMEDAEIALNYLQKRYGLSVITNGFDDVQSIKLKYSRLDRYFPHVFTSESTGYRKPSPEIFQHALQALRLRKEEVLMIGDNPRTDILGAQNAGIIPLFYNPTGLLKSECELQITHLSELLKIL